MTTNDECESSEKTCSMEQEAHLADESHGDQDLASTFLHSMGHSVIQAPIDGVREVVNTLTGKRIIPKIEIIKKPEPAEITSSKWQAQKLGTTAGLLTAGFLLVKVLTRRG